MPSYRGHNLVLKVTVNGQEYTVGVVEGADIDFGFEGGPEAIYGSRTKRHSVGTKRISFTITRWYYADDDQEDLLLDLFTEETEFTLEGSLIDNDDNPVADTAIKLLDCRIYRWRPRTGGADDILGEEASGFALDWDFSEFEKSTP
jgi:hypothetical protein